VTRAGSTSAATAVLIAAALLMVSWPLQAQCAMCRSALESPDAASLASALRGGILFLLAAPFVTVAVIALSIGRSVQRSRRTFVEPPLPPRD
jgi:hypothetical protein